MGINNKINPIPAGFKAAQEANLDAATLAVEEEAQRAILARAEKGREEEDELRRMKRAAMESLDLIQVTEEGNQDEIRMEDD